MAITTGREKYIRKLVATGETLIPVNSKAEANFVLALKVDASLTLGPETAEQFLSNAQSVMQQRGETYDSLNGERSMGNTVAAFNAITGHELTESDGWLFMETLKNVRQYQTGNYHADSAEDGVAYSALKAEAQARGD